MVTEKVTRMKEKIVEIQQLGGERVKEMMVVKEDARSKDEL